MWDDRKLHGKAHHASPPRSRWQRREGQALVEYVLIVALVMIGLVVILSLVGPALGNVFSNQVTNLIGQNGTPFPTLNETKFWDYVTAVASYTPIQPPFATFTKIGINSPTPTITNTVIPPTVTPINSDTPTVTPTNGPSPTPTDRNLGMIGVQSYTDSADNAGQDGIWYLPRGEDSSAFSRLTWDTQYFANTPFPSAPPSVPASTHPYDQGLLIDYTSGFPDAGGLNADFFVRFANPNVRFEGRVYNYTLRVGPNDHAKVSIGSTVISLDGDSANGLPGIAEGSYAVAPNDYSVTPGIFMQPVTVEYWAGDTSSFRQLFFNFNPVADSNNNAPPNSKLCRWAQGPGGTTGPFEFNIAQVYQGYSCAMRLRGYMSVPASVPANSIAALTFEDKFRLSTGTGTVAQVGIREYTWDGSATDWNWLAIHNPSELSLTYGKRYFNLASFNGQSYLGKTIELAFRIDGRNADTNISNWQIDDIKLYLDALQLFTIESSDDADTVVGNLAWDLDCNWGYTNVHHNSSRAYADSPLGNYPTFTDCSMATKGVLDLSTYSAGGEPELDFWTMYSVLGNSTYTVETQKVEDRGSNIWYPLTPRGSVNPWVANGNDVPQTSSGVWEEKAFSLLTLYSGAGTEVSPSRKYFFRFRMNAASPGADGIYLDEIKFRTRPSLLRNLPFYDPFDASTINNWALGGQWARTTNVQRTSPGALTDSLTASVPASTNTTATLVSQLQLLTATNPVVEFWIRYDLLPSINIYLETQIETDGPSTWRDTWKYEPAVGDPDQKDLAWQHIVIPVKTVGGVTYTGHQMSLRFRLDSVSGGSVDGVTIDDLYVWDNVTPYVTSANPFYDNMDSQAELAIAPPSTSNWASGGDWKLTTQDKHSGTKSWYTSNPATANVYPSPGSSALEAKATMDLTGVTDPVLSFWSKYSLQTSHFLMAEAKRDTDTTWTPLNWESTPASSGTFALRDGVNGAWTRNLIALTSTNPLLDFTNQKINIRFRLVALPPAMVNAPAEAGGWYLDDVYVGPRNQSNELIPYSTTFAQGFGGPTDLPGWTLEGNWQTVSAFSPWTSATAPGMTAVSNTYGSNTTDQWNADYYHLAYGSDPSTLNGTTITTCTPSDVVGYQISPLILTGTLAGGSGGTTSVSWTGGAPTPSGTSNKTFYVKNAGDSIGFEVPAGAVGHVLKVYVRYEAGTGSSVDFKMDASLSDASAIPVNQTVNLGTGGSGDYLYTFTDYRTTTPTDTRLTVTFKIGTAVNPGTKLHLRAIMLTQPANSGAASLTFNRTDLSTTSTVPLSSPPNISDWAAYGNDTTNFAPDRLSCIKGVTGQTTNVVDYEFATNLPFNNSAWTTSAKNNEYFYAVYKRTFSFAQGTYRFWLTASDGAEVWQTNVSSPTPTKLSPSTILPYPFNSPSNNAYIDQQAEDYFYEVDVPTAATYTIEIRFYKKSVNATQTGYLRFRSASKLPTSYVLHNTASGDYGIGERSAAYVGGTGWTTSGGITPVAGGFGIPAYTNVRIRFSARWVIGGTPPVPGPVSPDIFGIYYTKKGSGLGDGTQWTEAPIMRWDRIGPQYQYVSGSPSYVPVAFTYNKNDTSGPYDTYQNWDNYIIDIPGETVPYVLNLKFEIDSRNNFISANAADGWYIDDLVVIPN